MNNLITRSKFEIPSTHQLTSLRAHSWDQDSGHLAYSEYIQYREKLVSHLPPNFDLPSQPGWTAADGISRQVGVGKTCHKPYYMGMMSINK